MNAYLHIFNLLLNVTGQIYTPAALHVAIKERNIGGQKASLNMIVAQHHHALCHALPCGIYKRMYEHPHIIMSY